MGLDHAAARRHRPDIGNTGVGCVQARDANIGVVQIDRGVDVTRYQQNFIAPLGPVVDVAEFDDAVLIGDARNLDRKSTRLNSSH